MPVLAEALHQGSNRRLCRDLAAFLGEGWAKPGAAKILADEFARRADEPGADDLLLGALSRSFLRVAEETAFPEAVKLATDSRYAERYRCWFIWGLACMPGVAEEVVAVLLALLADPQARKYALEALGDVSIDALVSLDLAPIRAAAEGLLADRDRPIRNWAKIVLDYMDVTEKKKAAT